MGLRPLLPKVKHRLRQFRFWLYHRFGYRENTQSLVHQAYKYWNDVAHTDKAVNAHWRGKGVFADDRLWLKLGRDHWELFHRLAESNGRTTDLCCVVEWGCGGGMNAVHFGKGADAYFGVDISRETLVECARQCAAENVNGFRPVLIHPEDPQKATAAIGQPVSLFLSTYVLELLPTPEHGEEVIEIASQLLPAKGLAFFQFRYDDGTVFGRSRPWQYAKNIARNVTYRREDFERRCASHGLQVVGSQIVAEIPELRETCYAYYLLEKKSSVASARNQASLDDRADAAPR